MGDTPVVFEKVPHTIFTGKDTCAYEPYKFCPFMFTKSFGQKFVCILFDVVLHDDENGCLKRCLECKEKIDYILGE